MWPVCRTLRKRMQMENLHCKRSWTLYCRSRSQPRTCMGSGCEASCAEAAEGTAAPAASAPGWCGVRRGGGGGMLLPRVPSVTRVPAPLGCRRWSR